jgi:hypothetical protein
MWGRVGWRPQARQHGALSVRRRWRCLAAISAASAVALLVMNVWPQIATAAAPLPSGTPASLGDAYATGDAMPHYLGQPTSWAWEGAMPGVRHVVYYGIDRAPDGGVVGWYNANGDGLDGCLINQLYAQAQQYGPVLQPPSHPGPPCSLASQELQPWYGGPADPSHPVMMGLDVVNPTVQPANGDGTCTNYCIARLTPDRLQHFVDLTGANHMYLWLDMTIGRSPVQRELAEIWPYLQLPWVQVALDPEWDFVYGGSCGSGLPNFDTGRMRASEINYVIDQLSALVQTRHLPPKILIVHEFAPEVNPANASTCADPSKSVAIPNEGWQHIQLKPGVQVVVNADGFGGPDAKQYIYNEFDNVQRIQYGGFKLFYAVNSLHDAPLMTPNQVIGMDPPPLLIMFA